MKFRWVIWLSLIIFVWIVLSRFTEIEKMAKTLGEGDWQWVGIAALLQVVYYVVYTGIYQSAFYTVEVESSVTELLPVTFASLFLNVAAPSAGASGAALFVDDAKRRGQSGAKTAVGTLLMLVADFASFTIVLAAGLFYLFLAHDLKTYEITAAIILLALTLGLTALLGLGLWAPEMLRGLLSWVQRMANRVGSWVNRPVLLSDKWAADTFEEFTDAALAIAAHPERLGRTLAIALAAHFIDLLSLAALFRAFHQPLSLGVLVAGYAMGILFWIVSITPQGIGVVEGTMALVFTSLGVPAEHATVIALSFRGITFWLPMFVGFLLLRRVRAFAIPEPERPVHWRLRSESLERLSSIWDIRLAALLTGLMGVVNIISAVTPALADRLALLEQISPLEVRRGSHLAAALAGIALIMLAGGLLRRKRAAWLLTMAALAVSAISHITKGLNYEEAILALALAAWLLYMRSHFHAHSDKPSVEQGLRALALGFVCTLAYGVAGFYLLDRHFSVNFGLWAAMRQTASMFVQLSDPGLQPVTSFGKYFAGSIYSVGVITMSYAFLMLVRPVLAREKASTQDRQRAQAIVEAYGRSSLARMTLFEDKIYHFCDGGSMLAYAVEGRVALALGDPIGPAQDLEACITSFNALCTANDWLPAFYQTAPDMLDQYLTEGFEALCIGHEGIVDLKNFTLAGGENKGLRSAVNRFTRLGYRAYVLEPPIPATVLHSLRIVSDEWLTMVHGSEKRFSLGWFNEAYISSGQVMVVSGIEEGHIIAFANIVPEYQRNEVAIDLMRYLPGAEKGTMDFLFAALFEWALAKGYDTFNLGLSALSGVGELPQDPAIERALHYIYEHVNQFYNFKGLHEYKEKFHPTWSPRYLIYPTPASLPQVVLAMIRADSGDDMLSSYLLSRRRHKLTAQNA